APPTHAMKRLLATPAPTASRTLVRDRVSKESRLVAFSSRDCCLRIDFEKALELAWEWVGSQDGSHTLYQELTEEQPWGWIFYWGVPLPEGTRPQRESAFSLKIDRNRGQVRAGSIRRRVGDLGARVPRLTGEDGPRPHNYRRSARRRSVVGSS